MSKLKELTKHVAKYEKELNSLIQESLNNHDLINNTNEGLQKHLNTLRKFRKFNEIITQQLNLPTKDDVAAISRLVMQLEEKVDHLEDLLMQLFDENPSALSQESFSQGANNHSEAQQSEIGENDDQEFEVSEEESPPTLRTKIMNLLSEMGMKVLKDAVRNALAQRGNTGA